MHESSFLKMEKFRDTYCSALGGDRVRVLDVGAMSHIEQGSFRLLFGNHPYEYVGLDVASGANVDIVPSDPYSWDEIGTGSFDVAISGQSFEHNPYPWLTMAEIARVLRPGGLVCAIAPSTGDVHRFPFDCWRFYPDAGSALCTYVGLDVIESYVEDTRRKTVSGAIWADFMLVAKCPQLDATADTNRLERLRSITATRCAIPASSPTTGPAIRAYEAVVAVPRRTWALHRIRELVTRGQARLRGKLERRSAGRRTS